MLRRKLRLRPAWQEAINSLITIASEYIPSYSDEPEQLWKWV